MHKSEAIKIVQEAFGSKFNEKNFGAFISNLLKKYDAVNKIREGKYIREAFREFVSKYNIIGYFVDNAGNKIHVLQVFLHKGTSLSRARTEQRNFVADYLKRDGINAALVAFIAPEEEKEEDWRFSLVKLEYSLDVKDGKSRTSEEITPAKRWSFLVGKHEGSHTAQSRFVPLLEDDKEPNLAELEGAFNIEKVTNEFFEKYCDLFLRMKESLDHLLKNDDDLKRDFDLKEISTVDFAKKTLGQIAFLYFLQKKGWFGVHPDREWGSGVKNFLRKLFEAREKYGTNFFDDVLEPLFYEALAQDRGKEAIYPKLNNCRMPFLNGGLFEPMNGYSWETTHINIPDELFSNEIKDEKTGDIGNGIFDVFDRYNFTVNENEPLEKEVAVDPEMLGKVFENLLEIRDRKSKGAFYTPREIVHYMCQESLINYLCSETGETIPREDIETFVQKGIQIIQNDKLVLEKGRETDTYKFILPESIRNQAERLDKLLANIKVCDPAVGSGAFPLGMLNEIVRARQVLGAHSKSSLSLYDLKLHAISHSIYGVDLDSGAVEIAKLRLWLALVVEEVEPHPLPNIEHKIMQGNSLLSEYEGIKLFDDSFLANANTVEKEKTEITNRLSELQKEYFDLHSRNQLTPMRKVQIEIEIKQIQKRLESFEKKNEVSSGTIGLFEAPAKQKVAQEKTEVLQKRIEQFISESRRTQKQGLKEEIDGLKWDLIEATLEEQGRADKLDEIKKLRRKNIRPFFIWKLEFSDVFKEKGGFDIVIGNPPYGAHLTPEEKENFKKIYTEVHMRTPDTFNYFIALASRELVKEYGFVAYIVPNNLLFQSEYEKTRRLLIEKNQLITVINLGDGIFESATVPSCIFIVKRNAAPQYEEFKFADLRHFKTSDINYGKYLLFSRVRQILDVPGVVFGVSGCNFEILKKISTASYTIDDIALEMASGISTGGDNIFRIDKPTSQNLSLERGLLKPVLVGAEIGKYYKKLTTENLLIYTMKQVTITDYPNCYDHLKPFKEKLSQKRETKKGTLPWWCLHWGRYQELFTEPKIVMRQTADCIKATYDDQGYFALDSILILKIKPESHILYKFALAILNSKVNQFAYRNFTQEGGRTFAQVKSKNVRKLFIPKVLKNEQQTFIDLVDKIFAITSASDYDPKCPPIGQKELEAKIDEMVFDLYGLTPEEREIILKS